ncbi:MAG: exosome complex protein Rrp42 [Desulfurococcales archaeon]|nr:exosome complex protein Rrp42 [Desulfurococcales archaeon]
MSMTPFRIPIVPDLKRQTLLSLLEKGLRPDKRGLYDTRDVSVEIGVVERAEGSALVKLGKTQVLAGVKAEIGTPFRDTPDEGVITVNAEFVPLASPYFEPGPPDENAIELARVVDRSLREVNAVDRKSLVIIPGEKVWILFIDLYVLDHDGNLFDASMLAAMAALLNTKLPEYEELETGEIVIKRETRTAGLKINHIVVSGTSAKIGKHIIVDPNLEEETVSDARLVVSFDENLRIVGAQKTGPSGLSHAELYRMIEASREAAKTYFKALIQAYKDSGLPVKVNV